MEQTAISHYTFFLEQVLTPKRLQHSFGVMQVMGELDKVYALTLKKQLLQDYFMMRQKIYHWRNNNN